MLVRTRMETHGWKKYDITSCTISYRRHIQFKHMESSPQPTTPTLQTPLANLLLQALDPILKQRRDLDYLRSVHADLRRDVMEKEHKIQLLELQAKPETIRAQEYIANKTKDLVDQKVNENEILFYCILRTICGRCITNTPVRRMIRTDIDTALTRFKGSYNDKEEKSLKINTLILISSLFHVKRKDNNLNACQTLTGNVVKRIHEWRKTFQQRPPDET